MRLEVVIKLIYWESNPRVRLGSLKIVRFLGRGLPSSAPDKPRVLVNSQNSGRYLLKRLNLKRTMIKCLTILINYKYSNQLHYNNIKGNSSHYKNIKGNLVSLLFLSLPLGREGYKKQPDPA